MRLKIIFVPIEGWFTTFQRPHHFARYFKNENEIIVIQKQYVFTKKRAYTSAQIDLIDRLYNIYQLRGGGKIGLIRYLNSFLYKLQLTRLLSQLVDDATVIYTWNVTDTTCLERKGNAIVVYDAMDDWSAFEGKESVAAMFEEQLAREADIVLSVSQKLFERFYEVNRNTLLVRNGADTDYFGQAVNHVKSDCDALHQFAHSPIIGYVGHLGGWVDSALIVDSAVKLPEYKFVVIGPCSRSTEQLLRSQPNVIYVGAIPYDSLIPYVAYFSVGLIPFILNQLNESTNPIKLYEYLAAGMPVVSTTMPEVVKYAEEGVVFVSERNEFPLAITNAVNCSDVLECVERRLKVASENSWEARVSVVTNALLEQVNKRKLNHEAK